jgi:hypothetical protein
MAILLASYGTISRGAATCETNEILFMNKCFCAPGWKPKVADGSKVQCLDPVLEIGGCSCKPEELKDRSFVRDFKVSITPNANYRCKYQPALSINVVF